MTSDKCADETESREQVHSQRGFARCWIGGGNLVEKYTYDAFGRPNVTNADGSGGRTWSNWGNPFMFQGREYFPGLWLYDYRHRWYDAQVGRFLQTDPTGFDAGDMNLFRYCGDDPVDRTDPTGLLTRDWPEAARAIDQAATIQFFEAERKASQNVTVAEISQVKRDGKAFDRRTVAVVKGIAYTKAAKLLTSSESENGFEYSAEVARNRSTGEIRGLPVTRGEDVTIDSNGKVSKTGQPMHGSPVRWDQVRALGKTWDLIAHIYTGAFYSKDLMSRDMQRIFNQNHIIGVRVTRGTGTEQYHVVPYNPPL